MLFPTLTFAIFFLVVFPVSWLLRSHDRLWKPFILVASYVFYGFWDWRFVFLLMTSTVVNQLLAHAIVRDAGTGRRRWIGLAVVFNLGVLGVFKYYGFFIESVNALLRTLGVTARLPFLEVILPVGISFFTFQALSYVADIYRGKLKPVSWSDFAVYIAFFPHLVAGPIVRASEFLPQMGLKRRLTRNATSRATLLIAQGLFKKVVISSYLSTTIVDPVFAIPGQYSGPEILLAVYGYAIQIYADFSGYTDMAIGIALLLGFKFPQNFDRPYIATSIQDFWRRWHMTLSRWLRDYLYIPLGGNRGSEARTYINLILTMALGGLWHGAAMNFIVWGVYHGLGLAVERAWSRRPVAIADALPEGAIERPRRGIGWLSGWVGRLITFHFVCLGWVFFRSETLSDAAALLGRLVSAWGSAPTLEAAPAVGLVVLAALAAQYLPDPIRLRIIATYGRTPILVQGVVMGVFMALVVALGPKGIAPFIYFQF